MLIDFKKASLRKFNIKHDVVPLFVIKNDSESSKELKGSIPKDGFSFEYIHNWIKIKNKSKTDYLRAITYEDNLIGHIGLYSIDKEIPEFGIYLGFKLFWGKGIASYVIPIFFKNFLKNNESCSYISLFVNKNHFSAISLYQKIGFEFDLSKEILVNKKNEKKFYRKMLLSTVLYK